MNKTLKQDVVSFFRYAKSKVDRSVENIPDGVLKRREQVQAFCVRTDDDLMREYRDLYIAHGNSLREKADVVRNLCIKHEKALKEYDRTRNIKLLDDLKNDIYHAKCFRYSISKDLAFNHARTSGNYSNFIDIDPSSRLYLYMKSGAIKIPSFSRVIGKKSCVNLLAVFDYALFVARRNSYVNSNSKIAKAWNWSAVVLLTFMQCLVRPLSKKVIINGIGGALRHNSLLAQKKTEITKDDKKIRRTYG